MCDSANDCDCSVHNVLGIDLGTRKCIICVPKKNGVGYISLNGHNYIPAYICLLGNQRLFGFEAEARHRENINQTYYNLKHLVGREFEDVEQNENLYFPIEKGSNGEILIRTLVVDKEFFLTTTQLLAMVFTYLKHKIISSECVINCPNYFTDWQKREILNAALIADFKVLKLITDSTALTFCYCLFSNESPDKDNHVLALIDIGYRSTQCSILNFDPKNNFGKVLTIEFDKNLGGKNFDEILANYFIEENKWVLDKKMKLSLIKECEKVKIHLSKNSQATLNFTIDNDSFSLTINRSKFEELCKDYFERIRAIFKKIIVNFEKLKNEDLVFNLKITQVELTGGTCKIPAICNLARDVFKIEPSFEMNKTEDNSAIGCVLQYKCLNPCSKAERKFKLKDYQPYQINAVYYHEHEPDTSKKTINALFRKGCPIPYVAQFKLDCNKLPLIFDFNYNDELNEAIYFGKIKVFSEEELKFKESKIKLEIKLDDNGLFEFSNAQLEIVETTIAKNPKKPKNKKGKVTKTLKIVDLKHKIIWLKGHMNEKKIEELKDFDLHIDDEYFYSYNLVDVLKEKNDKYIKLIKKEEFCDNLSFTSRNNFIIELEDNKEWLQKEEEKDKNECYDRLTLLVDLVIKIENEIKDNKRKKEILFTLNVMIDYLRKKDSCYIRKTQDWINSSKTLNNKVEEDSDYSYSTIEKKLKILIANIKNIVSGQDLYNENGEY